MDDLDGDGVNLLHTIKNEVIEDTSALEAGFQGRAVDFQFLIQPKTDQLPIKNEFNKAEFVGEIIEGYEIVLSGSEESQEESRRNSKKLYVCEQCDVKCSYKNHDLHADFIRITTKELNASNPYKCTTCNLQFSNSKVALFHLSLHDQESFSCFKCDYKTNIFLDYIQHVENIHSKDQKVFRCFQCNYLTTWRAKFNIHRNTFHTAPTVYKCLLCDEHWPDPNHSLHEKMIHIRNKYATKSYVCKECNISLDSIEDIYDHLTIHGDIGIFCSFCSFTADNLEDLENHRKSNHLKEIEAQTMKQKKINDSQTLANENYVKCVRCDRYWPDTNHVTHEKMLLVEKNINEDNPYKCVRCGKIDHNLREVYNHVNWYCVKPKCPYCSKVFSRRIRLQSHIATEHEHEGAQIDFKFFTCKLCDYKTYKLSNLRNHEETHKKMEERKRYNCQQCDFTTVIRNYLNKHRLRMHPVASDKLYSCDQCSYSTYLINAFSRHAIVHSNQLFKCEICDLLCRSKSTLHKHKKKQHFPGSMQEKPTFVCELCAKIYHFKPSLMRHLREVHQVAVAGYEVKEYICHVCNYKQSSRQAFIQHSRIHLEGLEYLYCANCEYKTQRKMNLIQHMVKHMDSSKMELHKCKICSFATKRAHILRNHVKYTHKPL